MIDSTQKRRLLSPAVPTPGSDTADLRGFPVGEVGDENGRGRRADVPASPGVSLSSDGRRFLWNQTDHQDADLVLVENFR
jgi:hypothetical protein